MKIVIATVAFLVIVPAFGYLMRLALDDNPTRRRR